MSALREMVRDLGLPDSVFVDVGESDDAYVLVLDLPGTTAETVDAWVEGNKLRIEARREKENPTEFRYLQENRSLFIDVVLPLPPDVDTDADVDDGATVQRGVLELRLPKSTSKGHRIPITEG